MHRLGLAAGLGVAASLALTAMASASVTVKTRTVSYSISGKTGDQLLDAMDRHGPKHGFLTRAIAQTSYTISWSIDWQEQAARCRVADAQAELAITYSYPRVASAISTALKRRWTRFMAGVRKHEETHGRIARQMVNAAEKSIRGVTFKNDPGCHRTQAEVTKRIGKIFVEYEGRQAAFDRNEHAEGGNVEHLVTRLGKAL